MTTENIKKLAIQIMIGSLIGAAFIAVVAVLAGSFNDTFARALFTLFLVMVHALLSLFFIGQSTKTPNSAFKFFENVAFAVLVLSFFTSIFGVWGIFEGSIVGRLYGTYFVLLFACLHGQMLAQTRGKQSNIDAIVTANYVLMSVVIMLLLPIIWLPEDDFPSFYYRLLAASGIIDATLTILAVIFHKMYVQKHPTVQSPLFSVPTQLDSNGKPILVQTGAQKRHIHPLVWILGILLVGQYAVSLVFALLGAW